MKKRYKNKFDKNRRDLLKILTSAGITRGLLRASPLVGGMMLARLADAAPGDPPNKSVVIYIPNGAIPDQWYPNANLSTFPAMSQPYQSVAAECNFLQDMSHHRGGHGVMPTIINNKWTNDSFDVNIGRTIGENNPFPYINLGVHSNGHGYLTRDNGTEVPFEDNPFNAFNRLFGNGGTIGGGANVDTKTNIIDAHKEALDSLKTKLGTYERDRLDSHVTAIEETQQRLNDLNSGGTGSCDVGPVPTTFALEFATFRQQAELQAKIIGLALKCNLTSSASLALGNHQGEFSLPYLSYKGIYHQSIHGGNNGDISYPHFRETRAHLSSLSANVINQLRTEGLLDSTIVCEVTDMGNGDGHGSAKVPLIMAGGGGKIQRNVSNAGSASYNPLSMIHTAAVALSADQHPKYQGYASDVIPGVLT